MPEGAGQRIVTGLVASAFVVSCNFLFSSLGWLAISTAVFLVAMVELVGMLRKWVPATPRIALLGLFFLDAALLAAAVGAWIPWTPALAVLTLATCLTMLPGLVALCCAAEPRDVPLIAVLLSFGPAWIALPLASAYGLHLIDPWWMFLLMGLVSFGDSMAWACGSAWGRHKLAPRISPKKSWEGAAAGLAGSLFVVAVFSWSFFDRIDPVLLGLGALAALAGQIGDLVESLFKRGVGVKDSSGILPGHGGFLDRIDAVLLASPVFYGGLALAGYGPLP